MDKNSILSKISSLFESEKEEMIEVNLMEVTTIDGKILNIDSLEIGYPIFIKEGEEFVPFIDGEAEITIEDKTFVVKSDETGKILSIEEKQSEQPTVEEVPVEQSEEVELSLESLSKRIEVLESKLLEKETEMQSQVEELSKENEELKEKFNKLPAAESVKSQIKKFEYKEEKQNTQSLEEWVKTLKQ